MLIRFSRSLGQRSSGNSYGNPVSWIASELLSGFQPKNYQIVGSQNDQVFKVMGSKIKVTEMFNGGGIPIDSLPQKTVYATFFVYQIIQLHECILFLFVEYSQDVPCGLGCKSLPTSDLHSLHPSSCMFYCRLMICRLLDMDFHSSQRLQLMIQCRIWWQLARRQDTYGCILFCSKNCAHSTAIVSPIY